jgi:polyferredoxin
MRCEGKLPVRAGTGSVTGKSSPAHGEEPARGGLDRRYVRKVRYAFQWGLFALIAYAGYRFYLFERHFILGTPEVARPPLVEGFLPIGSLMSLKLWLTGGVFDTVHPAGLVIFGAALVISALLKKSFCGWICPVGALSEQAYRLGGKILGSNPALPGYADYILRSIKYLLMGFFLYVVLIKMDGEAVAAFMDTPYWKVADVKMLHFFTHMSMVTMVTLLVLTALSLPLRNFWCRYLCPYGALLGLLSYLSPAKITRREEACIHCKRCSRNCPSLLPVERKTRVRSPECTGCLTCVSGCPSRGALEMALPGGRPLLPMLHVILLTVVFFGIIGAARLTGHWQSDVPYDDYKVLVPEASHFDHP